MNTKNGCMERCVSQELRKERKKITEEHTKIKSCRYLLHAEWFFYYNKTNKIIVKNIDQLPNGPSLALYFINEMT